MITTEVFNSQDEGNNRASWPDDLVCCSDMTPFVQKGQNVLTLSCETDGTFEQATKKGHVFLAGDFTLKKLETQWEVSNQVTLSSIGSWQDKGYPFYAGSFTYRTVLYHDQDDHRNRCKLHLGEVKECASIRVNDQDAGVLLWPPFEIDIGHLLHPGDNVIEVTVWNTLHNALVDHTHLSGLIGPVTIG